LAGHVAVVKADHSQALPEYLLSSFQSPTGFSRLLAARVETFKANISLGTVREFKIPVPPIPFQKDFCARVSALKDARAQAESCLAASSTLAAEILNRLMEENK
jgi:restriction endonuclease S subunit